MNYFENWKEHTHKDIEDKKRYFNGELLRIMKETMTAQKIEQFKKLHYIKGSVFRMDLKIKGKTVPYLDILICNPTGKVLYWALYEYQTQTLKPQQDVLYLDFILDQTNKLIPLFKAAFS